MQIKREVNKKKWIILIKKWVIKTSHDLYVTTMGKYLEKELNISCCYIQMNLILCATMFVPSVGVYLGARNTAVSRLRPNSALTPTHSLLQRFRDPLWNCLQVYADWGHFDQTDAVQSDSPSILSVSLWLSLAWLKEWRSLTLGTITVITMTHSVWFSFPNMPGLP